MDARNQFTFYRSFRDAIASLPKREQLGAMWAIVDFALDGKEPTNLTWPQQAVYSLIGPVLQAAKKKASAGQKGGSKTKASKQESKIENKIENEIENEIEDKCLAQGFDRFWEEFPLKVGKEKARQVWNQQAPSLEEVLEGLGRWKNSRQWDRENGRFIPRAWRFLQDKAYLEQPPEKVPMGATGVLGQAELEAIAQVMAMDS